MGKILAVASGKGGTGKSTCTVGLGAALNKMGKSVLLVDMDQGLRSLDSMLGLSEHMAFDISDALEGRVQVSEAILPIEGRGGLFMLGAPRTAGAVKDEEKLRKLITGLAGVYDYVILDSPAGIGRGFDLAVCAAQAAAVVTGSDFVSIRDAGIVYRLLCEKGVSECRLIINMVKIRLIRGGFLPNIDRAIDTSGMRLLGLIPEDDSLLMFSSAGAVPSKGKAVSAFERLAARIEGQTVPLPKKIKPF
ncbi:MAG TPA: septum site-determining protein MinD [Ruminococcaceae bacterium]|nr:septum site-determining protein MinD [Oscillospiraceae bacterium]